MATTYTSSAASGYASQLLFYSDGPFRVMRGHYSAPNAGTAVFETGFRHIDSYYVQDADVATFAFSSNSTSEGVVTVTVLCSGLVTGATGYFEFRGW